MSHAAASSQPPPSAKPLIAAIVGFGIVSSNRPASWPSAPHAFACSGSSSLMYLMSAPATNAFSPAPVSTTTRTSPSAASSRSRSRSSLRVVRGDRAADDDQHVAGFVLAQEVDDARDERHVRAREDRDADRVGVLLDRRLDDLLR